MEIEVNPNWRWPKSNKGITAPFLYCGGYLAMISSDLFKFSELNSNGVFWWLASVSLWTEMMDEYLLDTMDLYAGLAAANLGMKRDNIMEFLDVYYGDVEMTKTGLKVKLTV